MIIEDVNPEGELDLFRAWFDQMLALQETVQRVQSPLYHYTDASGLLGIVRNEEIWLSSMFHLNDPSELDYGLKIACDILEAESNGSHALTQEICSSFLSMHSGLKDFLGFYVSSLSKVSDDLGQWRAYGDNGRGFAIGLAPHLFHPVKLGIQAPNERTYVAEVAYGREKAEMLFREPIRRAVTAISRAKPNHFNSLAEAREFCRKWSTALTIPIFWYALQVKHKAYSSEQETRLIINAENAELRPYIDLRTRGSNVVPFIRSPLAVRAPGSVIEIVIGPCADPTAEDSLRTLFLSQGLSQDIRVWRSDIPYRAL